MTIKMHQLMINGIADYSLLLGIYNGKLVSVSFQKIELLLDDNRVSNQFISLGLPIRDEDQKIILQFKNYFKNPAIDWKLNFDWPKRTLFQCRVLDYLTTIALGSTKTYGQIAKDLHTSARAVGNACRHNPFPIVIPCHRVVAQNDLGGYDGDRNLKPGDLSGRLAIKYFLLKHEQAL